MSSGLGEICQVQQLGHADCKAASSKLLGLRRQKRELQWCCDEHVEQPGAMQIFHYYFMLCCLFSVVEIQ